MSILPVLFSVSPVLSCCVCLLHFHLHAQRSCCFIQPYHSKEFIFHKSSLTYSNISARSCSRHVALGDILISLWKSLLTSSLLVGLLLPTREANGNRTQPFVIAASMAPKLEPFCVLYRNTEYRTLTRKPVVLALLGCWTSCRPTFHPQRLLLCQLLQPSCPRHELAGDDDCPCSQLLRLAIRICFFFLSTLSCSLHFPLGVQTSFRS